MLDNDERTGPAGSHWLICPLGGCPWRHQRIPIWGGGGNDVTSVVTRAMQAGAEHDEEMVRQHLATHPVEDYLRTIQGLRVELEALRRVAPGLRE